MSKAYANNRNDDNEELGLTPRPFFYEPVTLQSIEPLDRGSRQAVGSQRLGSSALGGAAQEGQQ
jgi:hypothetical protein